MGHISAGVHVGCFSFPFSQQFSGSFEFSICIASVIYSSTVPRVPASHHITSQGAGCRLQVWLSHTRGEFFSEFGFGERGKSWIGFLFSTIYVHIGFLFVYTLAFCCWIGMGSMVCWYLVHITGCLIYAWTVILLGIYLSFSSFIWFLLYSNLVFSLSSLSFYPVVILLTVQSEIIIGFKSDCWAVLFSTRYLAVKSMN